LAQLKTNLGPKARAVEYKILDASIDGPKGPISVGRVEWCGESNVTADMLLGSSLKDTETEAKPSKLAVAMAFLRQQLAAGPKPSHEVKQGAAKASITDATLYKAQCKLGIVSKTAPGNITMW